MRDLPPGAANSRDWFRPEGFTALRVLTSQNPTSKLIAARDKRYPMPSTAASHSGSGFLSRSFPSRQNLIRQRKTLAGQKNAKGYNIRLKLREGLRYHWYTGTAHLLSDDDPLERQRWLASHLPSSAGNARAVRLFSERNSSLCELILVTNTKRIQDQAKRRRVTEGRKCRVHAAIRHARCLGQSQGARKSDYKWLHLAQHSWEPGWNSVHRRQCH